MKWLSLNGLLACGVAMPIIVTALASSPRDQTVPASEIEVRAVRYLAAEVPRWKRDHQCYSCHNNGDATRALLAALAKGYPVGDALDDTMAWLATPERWDSNAKRGGSEELPLARIQFTSALAAMVTAGRAPSSALERAAALLVDHQRDDGSWRLAEAQMLGGATFYGTSLATAMARSSLGRVRNAQVQRPIARADEWLRTTPPASVLDASSILIGIDQAVDRGAVAQRMKALATLKRGQGPDGGWGPYVTSQSEPFDTALAVLALARIRSAKGLSADPYGDREIAAAIDGGRRYLMGGQSPDGSWPETTRPPNMESYAQRISTTAWSLLALIESDR